MARSGILSMPAAFSDGGLVIASICTPIIGLITTYCVHLLVRVSEHVCNELELPVQDYEEVAELTLENGPVTLRHWSRTVKFATSLFIVASQVGACAVYYLFIAENLKAFFDNYNVFGPDVTLNVYLIVLLPLIIALQFIKNVRVMAIPSAIANLLQVLGLGIIFYNIVQFDPNAGMPLYRTMANPKAFARPIVGVVDMTNIIIISLNFLLEPIYQSVQLMYAFAVLMTYPITMYVPIEMLWPKISNKLIDNKLSPATINVTEYLFRAGTINQLEYGYLARI
ncbi:unnamed protein product [Medioppia subpectinata]|uniref:Amino acid transporter transmembrane domain-containing protein n=1 Tax=Medioppia subpectinata TaxID=1979941 RepID=A0A7R9PWT1_9ACAR|nr:unnamed protein product [Medioppia subpectinata]CAG2103617.1 unnamed protein product [Medioppia subpectinata]